MVDLFTELWILAASIIILSISADAVVRASTRLTRFLGITEATFGIVFIAFATSIPELAVSVSAVLGKAADISIGNLIGSNITNLALIVGIMAILAPLIIRRGVLSTLSAILLLTSLFPLILVNIREAGRLIGVILIATFFIFVFTSVKAKPQPSDQFVPVGKKFSSALLLVAGLAGVLVSAHFVVSSAVQVAAALGVSQAIIGATIIALGTSLPELTIGVKAALRGRYGLALGNVVGSSITNLGLILGIVLLVSPIGISFFVFSDLVSFLIATNLIFWYLIVLGKVGKMGGLVLLMTYVLFVITTFFAGALPV